jgi:hypothetical protein
MRPLDLHLANQQQKLSKALDHLSYSYKKVLVLPLKIADLDEESLETWESFAARFSRVSELFLTRYLRTLVLIDDPGFAGTLRDFLNQAEKLGWLDNANQWMEIRGLRNIIAHDYSEKDLEQCLNLLRQHCPKQQFPPHL